MIPGGPNLDLDDDVAIVGEPEVFKSPPVFAVLLVQIELAKGSKSPPSAWVRSPSITSSSDVNERGDPAAVGRAGLR
ncbi:MAG: hypothetical protein ACODAD_02685, partial [Planctomycetota bacterium]